jgi:hypothetical protein
MFLPTSHRKIVEDIESRAQPPESWGVPAALPNIRIKLPEPNKRPPSFRDLTSDKSTAIQTGSNEFVAHTPAKLPKGEWAIPKHRPDPPPARFFSQRGSSKSDL